VPVDTPARYIALVDLASASVWLLSREDLAAVAQQRSSGRYHIYMYTDRAAKPRKTERLHTHEFQRFLLPHCAERVFG